MTTDRTLGQQELRSLAADLAADPALWRAHVRHDPGQRTYHPLLETEHAIAWLICWMPGHDTGSTTTTGAAARWRSSRARSPRSRSTPTRRRPASWTPTSPGPDGVLQRHVVPEGEELRADAFALV
jgi:hypothetical protein